MKDDLIERLAREAGLRVSWVMVLHSDGSTEYEVRPPELRRFAALVAEECAKVCEQNVSTDTDWDNAYWNQSAERCAWKIREKFT